MLAHACQNTEISSHLEFCSATGLGKNCCLQALVVAQDWHTIPQKAAKYC